MANPLQSQFAILFLAELVGFMTNNILQSKGEKWKHYEPFSKTVSQNHAVITELKRMIPSWYDKVGAIVYIAIIIWDREYIYREKENGGLYIRDVMYNIMSSKREQHESCVFVYSQKFT